MKSQKIFIGGRVDAGLKRSFLRELRELNRRSAVRVTQSGFFELLLLESLRLRRQRAKGKTRPSRAKK